MAIATSTSGALKTKRHGTQSTGEGTVEVMENTGENVVLKVVTATGRGAKLVISKGPELELAAGQTLTISAL